MPRPSTFFEKLLAHPQTGAAARDVPRTARLHGRDDQAVPHRARGRRVGCAAAQPVAGESSPPQLLATAGLVKARENGNGFYDTFRNRLMFPIRDEIGPDDRVWRAGHAGVAGPGEVSQQPGNPAVFQEPMRLRPGPGPAEDRRDADRGGRRGVYRCGDGPPVRGEQRRVDPRHGDDRAAREPAAAVRRTRSCCCSTPTPRGTWRSTGWWSCS